MTAAAHAAPRPRSRNARASRPYTVDIDIGGTLTDGLFSDGETVTPVKVDTTPHDFTVCFFECLKEGAKQLGFDDLTALLQQVAVIRWSATIATNIIAERKGPRIGLLVSEETGDELYGTTTSPAVGRADRAREHRPAAQGRLRQGGADRHPRAARAGRAPDRGEHGRRLHRRQRRAGGPAARRRELPRPLPRRRPARARQRDRAATRTTRPARTWRWSTPTCTRRWPSRCSRPRTSCSRSTTTSGPSTSRTSTAASRACPRPRRSTPPSRARTSG